MERQIGRKPDELIGPPFPDLLANVWSAFFDLNSTRSMGPNGPDPISFLEIKAYMDLTGTVLDSREIAALKRLDKTYIGVVYD